MQLISVKSSLFPALLCTGLLIALPAFAENWNPESFQKPNKKQLKQQLTELQYEVTQKDGTERPFKNKYWDNKADGIYVDVVSGEPLFSSTHKYKSGTGWPSFYQPIDKKFIELDTDFKLFYPRTEVRSKLADSHLGHVFDDGPDPTGKRYCMNSAAMRFIALHDMEKEGYGEYLYLFENLETKSGSDGNSEGKAEKSQ